MPARATKGASAKPKRVRRNPDDARKHILKAAIRVLSRKGPHAVGLKDVAREAGVSHALITHYFKTYEALVDAAVAQTVALLRDKLVATALATQSPSPATMVQVYLDTALEPWYGRLASWALFSHDTDSAFAERFAPDMTLLITAVEHVLVARMKPPPTRAQVEAIVVAVWSMAVGYAAGNAFFWRSLGRKPGARRDRDVREAIGAFARALFGED
ncbi:MAG: TetR/AcrR family transcriptional regulator [Polyangiales bacterium]